MNAFPDTNLQLVAITDDPSITEAVAAVGAEGEWQVVVYAEAARVFSSTADEVTMLLLDEGVAGANYISIVKRARRRFPAAEIMVVGGPKSDEIHISDRRAGVDYYYERPIERSQFDPALNHRLQVAALKARAGIVGRDPAIEDLIESLLQVGPTQVPILIEGESGTGKDLVARAVHLASRRSKDAYVAINCAALAEGVLESELFGHERGAFTGAAGQRAGVFERANGGTLFLDEVGETSPNTQVRLLRVLESGEVLRVGGVKSFRVDVRIVAATNKNLVAAVADGSFRQDLYYRLKGVSVYLSALRERVDDIPILVDYFIQQANKKHGKKVKTVDADALRALERAPWPGNVRELRNTIDTAVVLAPDGRVTRALVESQLKQDRPQDAAPMLPVPLHRTKEEAEREMIYASVLALHRDVREVLSILKGGGPGLETLREVHAVPDDDGQVTNLTHLERMAVSDALRTAHGNRRKAAQMLGISERTLYRKIKEYGLV